MLVVQAVEVVVGVGGARGDTAAREPRVGVLAVIQEGGGVCARVYARYGEAALYGPRSAPQDLARPRVLYGMASDNAHVTLFDCQHTDRL